MARYAETADVAPHVRMWTDAGEFTGDTNPTAEQLEAMLDQISSLLNAALSSAGFTVPVTDSDVTPMLKLFTASLAARLVNSMNVAGEPEMGWFGKLQMDIKAWVTENAGGLEKMGAGRTAALKDEIIFSDTDDSGDTIHPIFQREGFGNRFDNWDT